MDWRAFRETLVTRLVIMDPAATTPIFVGRAELTPRQRANAAVGAIAAATGLIVGFAVFGQIILDYLHVSLPSISIAGGLLLLLVGGGRELAPNAAKAQAGPRHHVEGPATALSWPSWQSLSVR